MGSPLFHTPPPVAVGFYVDGNGNTDGFTAIP